jgi:uncharacterized protein
MSDMNQTSEARVLTPKAGGYVQQLCKHFGHKAPVSFDDRLGRIELPMGVCTLEAAPDAGILTLRASALSGEDLARLEDVVARHLVRFAFREDLQVAWSRV